MAYNSKDNFDPDHLPSGHDMRKQRTLILGLVPIYLAYTTIMLGREAGPFGTILYEIIWGLLILVILANITGVLNRFHTRKYAEQQAILEDELAQHHRAISLQWGMVATILVGLGLFFVTPHVEISARHAVIGLIITGLTVTSVRFALLERDGDEGDE